MATYELVLLGVKGYYDGSDSIEREEFQAYVQALRLPETRPALQGVAYVLNLPADELDAHVEQMRNKGFLSYNVHPQVAQSHHTPITHIEPQSSDNLKALGFDVSTITTAREALDRARDTGKLALTSRLRLQQDVGRDAVTGLVMYLPLYRKDADLGSVEGRQRGIVGWVSAPFRMNDLLQGMARQLYSDIDLVVYDGDPQSAESLLYGDANLAAAAQGAAPGLRATQQIALGGRTWTLVMQPLPAFEQRFKDRDDVLLAAMGVALGLDKGRSAADKDKRVLAVIGDSTFLHMGMQGLLDIVYNKGNVTVLLLDNRAVGMTGGQDNPGNGRDIHGDPAPRVDFAKLVEALGVKPERIHVVDPYQLPVLFKTIRDEVKVPEVSVIITDQPPSTSPTR